MKAKARLLETKIRYLWSNDLSQNAAMSMLQALTSALCMFIAYRLMIREIGIDKLGLWSVLLAGSAAARLLDVSGSSGLARYVAERASQHDVDGLVQYVHTLTVAALGFNAVAGLLVLFFSDALMQHFVATAWHQDIRTLLPIALIGSIVLPALTSSVCSAIDGMQKARLRAICNMASSFVFLGGVVYWVPSLGVWGYGYALVAQQVFLLVVSWLTLHHLVPSIGLFPRKLSKSAFLESFGFGLRVQTSSLASLMSEPLAKFMLASLGGLTLLGYYEVASRLVFQAKGLFIAAMQPLMPALASLTEQADNQSSLLLRAQHICILTGTALFIVLVVLGMPYAWAMLGEWNTQLLQLIVVLSCGAVINLFSVPMYFASMAKGVMRWNIASQLAVAFCVMVSGTFAGPSFGGNAVIGGIVAGLALGGLICQFGNLHALRLYQTLQPLRWVYWGALCVNVVITVAICTLLQSVT